MFSGITVSQSLLLLLLLLALPLHGHEIRPAIVDLQLDTDGGYQLDVRLNLEALMTGISARHKDSEEAANAEEYNRLRALPAAQLADEFAGFQETFRQGIELYADGQALQPATLEAVIPEVGDTALARDSVLRLQGRLPTGAEQLSWGWRDSFGPNVLRVNLGETELHTAYLQPGDRSPAIALEGVAAQSAGDIFRNYIVIGFEHIVPKGIDHILFVLGLFLLSPHWRALLWQVSAFTLAHTLTLAMSMLGWVQLPTAIVEPLIAASIVYIAVENLFYQHLTRWRALLVFAFGLLHGLGFASVLADIGLSPAHFISGLIAFNIGVELGQLAVLTLCFLLVGLWFRKRPWYRRVITIPASLTIAVIGVYWFAERVGLMTL